MHTTLGAGLPAEAAAAVIVGAMWSRTVAGPVIHKIVPYVCSPASFSICGPSAATSTGTGASRGVDRPMWARIDSPSTLTGVPSSRGMSTERYSRMCRAGRSKLYPYMFSMTIWCDSPMPSVSRPPPMARAAVRACCASTAGWRG